MNQVGTVNLHPQKTPPGLLNQPLLRQEDICLAHVVLFVENGAGSEEEH
jgi:hypothetical protein